MTLISWPRLPKKIPPAMKLYNTLTKEIETFVPSQPGEASVYCCGPTVYDKAHVGNFRTLLLNDFLVRTLRYLGLAVTSVVNITDIDDKIIARAAANDEPISDLTARIEDLFMIDLTRLNIQSADVYPRATEHYPEMRELINRLTEKDFTYEHDGDLYFSIAKFPNYGRLSGIKLDQLQTTQRVRVEAEAKLVAHDFVLWKHDAHDSAGRPGWHLECSAMAEKYLGKTIDLHLGGVDLIFPHHENEIAQSEAANGQPFVRYFVHGEHMTLNGQRMGKSLGNTWTLDDLIEQGISPLAYRYLWLTTHYRSKLNLTLESLQAAQTTLKQLKRLSLESESLSDAERGQLAIEILSLIEDDLNFPMALAKLHEANSYLLWLLFEPILGLGLESLPDEATYPDAIKQLIKRRLTARTQKQFELSDQLRTELEEAGYSVEDRADRTVTVPTEFFDPC